MEVTSEAKYPLNNHWIVNDTISRIFKASLCNSFFVVTNTSAIIIKA